MRYIPIIAILLVFLVAGHGYAAELSGEDKYVSIIIIEGQGETTSSGLVLHSYRATEGKVAPSVIAKEFSSFMEKMKSVFTSLPPSTGNFSIEEVELNLAMNAEGGFSLIGRATAGMTTGVKVILRRKQ